MELSSGRGFTINPGWHSESSGDSVALRDQFRAPLEVLSMGSLAAPTVLVIDPTAPIPSGLSLSRGSTKLPNTSTGPGQGIQAVRGPSPVLPPWFLLQAKRAEHDLATLFIIFFFLQARGVDAKWSESCVCAALIHQWCFL